MKKGSHGEVDLHNAIVKSCDVYFYNVGQRLGIDRISYYATKLGLGRKTGVDLPGEEIGPGAVGGMEGARLPSEVVSGRDDFSFHRPGSHGGHAHATGVHHRRHRAGRASFISRIC